jgi:flagellar hook protein FlgE
MRSLFSGVSGLRNHQVRMDVIGNNIANVNTTAFKAGRVTFKEAFAQTLQGASRPAGSSDAVSGGVNPIQVGLGSNIGSIDQLFTQGNLENTGVTTDLAIQGESFFVVSDGLQRFFTRSGNFQLDAGGRMVASTNGFVVQGRMAEDGVLNDEVTDIRLPFGQKSAAQPTTEIEIAGNLDAQPDISGGTPTRETSIAVYDAMGRQYQLFVKFEYVDGTDADTVPDHWQWSAEYDDGIGGRTAVTTPASASALAFDSGGRLVTPASPVTVEFPDLDGTTLSMDVDFGQPGSLEGLTQFANASTAVARQQDGYTMGDLERFSIDQSGLITGAFTNGETITLGQIVLADFNNPSGLERRGDNTYSVSANSGAPVLGYANEGSQSMVTSGALEMSNVDLAQEFTNMITAQRGFQSNARVITTADEMLQEVVSLKR